MSEKLSVDPEYARLLHENFAKVRSGISAAAGGRDVLLIGATKTVSAEVINYAAQECGLTDIGENRVQELVEKYPHLRTDLLRLHFIGRLQQNKVKYIIDKVCMIHSVDSVKLAREIDRCAKKKSLVMNVLIEINVGREESKGGVDPDDVLRLAEEISEFENIRLVGVMSVPPKTDSHDDYVKHFGKTKEILDRLTSAGLLATDRPVMSAGMSDSYVTAIGCGANAVRIGTALFGKRMYKNNEEKNNDKIVD